MVVSTIGNFIFGASAGSVVTIVVAGLIAEYRSGRENKRLLKKIFFERR